jgi:hypothetical protein
MKGLNQLVKVRSFYKIVKGWNQLNKVNDNGFLSVTKLISFVTKTCTKNLRYRIREDIKLLIV